MTLEDLFQQSLEKWKRHIRSNSFSFDYQAYLQCTAYKQLVGMGEAILPLVRQELKGEIEAEEEYGSARLVEDGNPGALWAFLLQRINPKYTFSIEPEDSGAAVEQVGGFVSADRNEVMGRTLRWLEKYYS